MAPPGRLVTIKRSGEDGACFPLSLSSCSFGRDIECDIRIQLPVVSKLHCRIEVREQEATLYNFSSTNPTQLNGSVIEKPVLLEHGDVITIIDRSFRYEKEDSQNESKPDEFPGKGQEQAPLRRSSRSSLSAPPDGKTQDSGAHPKVSASRSQEPVKELREDGATSDGSEHRAAPDPPRLCSPEQVGNNGKKAGQLTSGGLKENSRATASPSGDLKSSLSSQSLDSSKKTESPFEKLYQSMKEELSLSSKKQRVAQNQRKSGLQLDCATEKERRETQSQMSHKARPRSGDSVYIKAASPFTPETDQSQEKGIRGDSTCASNQPLSSSIPLADTTKTPGPQQRKDKGPCIIGRESVNVGTSEGIRSAGRIVTPRKRLTGNHTSAIAECAVSPPVKSDSLSLRSRSIPTDEERLPSEVRKEPFVTQCPSHAENKIPKDFLDEPSKLAVKSGQIGSGLPGLSSVDISNFGDFINKSEGASLKRRRVSFGGRLKPELFDENLPPNTPLKRGETPGKRKCPVTHGPTVLKKIVKEQPGSEKEEDSSSEICLEVTAQNVCAGAPASSPGVTQPGVNGQRRRSGKASAASGGSESLEQTDAPKKAGRKSSGLSSKRASISRGQHDILQMICSKRRSGASEANLMVAKSWAEIVKLGVKQTQMKVVKHSPPKPVSRRQRRQSTPKKPTASIHQQFSTGHANSPCTIIIGKAQTKRVSIPARPSRMLNSFVFNRKMDYSEDLSGITELFKTPAKEKPQTAGPSSLPGKQFQEVNSGEQPLNSTASEIWGAGQNMFFSPQNSVQKPSDKHSESHTLNQQSLQDRSTGKTPQDVFKVTHLERTTPDAVEEPLNTVPSANKSRRSRELRSALTPPVKMKNERLEAAQADGKPLRKTPLRGQKGEGEDRKGLAETCKQSDKSKENSTKTTAVSRSRSEGQKLRPTKELLGTPTHTKEPDNEVDQTTETPYRASQGSDCSNTRKRQSKTPLRTADDKGDVPYVSDPTVRAHKTPDSGTARATGNPKHSRDPAISASGVKKGTRTPKKESQPLEDLAGFKELFQTANEPVTDDKTKPCQSPRPLPTSTKSQLISPTRKMDAKGLSALRKSVHLSGGNAYNPKVTQPDFTSIRALKETTEQLLHPSGNRTGSKRQWKSPGERTQLEDLAGFQELSQTPGHAKDTVTTDGPTQVTDETPRAATTRAPRSIQRKPRTSLENVCVQEVSLLTKQRQSPGQALKTSTVPTVPEQEGPIVPSVQTPEQKPGMTGHLTGSKRRSRASKGRSQLLGDLSGLQELFQTPDHSNHPMIVMKTAEIPSKPPQSEPVKAPTGVKRQTRTSLGNIGGGEFSPIMKQRPSLGKSLQTPTVPEQERPITALMQTPEQKPGMTGHLTSSKSRPRTSKGRSQLLGDLSGLQELFQTPDHGKDPRTPGEPAEIPSQSPEPGSAKIPGRTLRRSKTSLGKALVEGLLPGLGELSQASLHEPEGEDSGIQAQKPLSKRKLSSEASVTVSKRVRRSPREKAQPLEDLSCLQQLFQTPGHARDTAATDEITKMTSPSPKPGAVKTPGSTEKQPRASLGHLAVKEELSSLRKQRQVSVGTPTMLQPGGAISALGLTPEQKPHLTTAVFTGPNRRTPGRRSQALRDLPGLQELSQTPEHGRDRMTANRTTEVSGKWPQPEPVGTLIQTPDHNNHPMILMETTEMPSKLPRSEPVKAPTVPEQERPITALMQTPEQKPGMTGHLTSSKSRPRTSKGRSQLLGDLSGLQELFQTPDHGKDPRTPGEPAEIPSQSPEPGSAKIPGRTLRRSKTSLEKALVEGLLPGLGELSQASLHEPEGEDSGIQAQKPLSKRKLSSEASVTVSKRVRRSPREKAQPLEDLSCLQQLFQTPGHARDTAATDEITKMTSPSPKPGAVKTPGSTEKQPRASLGHLAVKEELSSLRKQRQVSVGTPTMLQPGDAISALGLTPEQKPHLTTAVFTGPNRRTPGRRSQALRDLPGLQELSQTPEHGRDRMTANRTTEVSGKWPQPEPVGTPMGMRRQRGTGLGNVDVKEELRKQRSPSGAAERSPATTQGEAALEESADQTLHTVAHTRGRWGKPRAPKERSQPLEDLDGLQELFRTPGHTKDMVPLDITGLPCASPQSEPVDTQTTPGCQSRSSVGKLRVKEELPATRELREVLGGTAHTHRVPDAGVTVPKTGAEAARPAHDLVRIAGGRLRRVLSREQAPPLEDLSGLPELFQTPGHTEEVGPCTAPQPEPTNIPTTSKRQTRASLGRASADGELLGLAKFPQESGETTHMPQVPGGEDRVRVVRARTKRKLDPAESVAGSKSKRLRGAPEEKAQPLDHLAGLQELSQTPGQTEDTTPEGTTKMSPQSPRPRALDIPAPSERTARTRMQTVEKKELPQDTSAPPERTARTRLRIADNKEGLPQDTSAPPERATRTRMRTVEKEEELPQDTSAPPERATRTRLRIADKKEELPGAKTLTRASRQTTRARKVLEGDVTDVQTSEESAKQTLDPGKSVSGTRRQRGSRKESPRALDGQAAPEEIIQTPAHMEDSGSDGNASKIACQSPQPEPDTDRTWRGQLRTRRGKAVVSKETLVPGKMPGPSQETSETPGEPVPGGKCVAMLKEPSEPGLAPAARVTRPKRLQGAAAEKAQALETLARPPEVLQEPCHMEDSAGDRKSTKMSCQPLQPQAQDTSAPPERAARTRMRTVEKEEELPQDTSAPPERTARTRLRIADKKEELPQDTSAPPERTARTRMRTVEKKEGLPQDTSAPPERATRTRLRTVGKEEELPQDTSAPPERAARRRLQTVEKKELPQDTSAPPERTARTRLQTVEKKEELPGARTLTRASRQTTRARKVPEGDVTDIQTSEESAKQTLDPGKSVSGTRRQRGSRKESPRALDGQAAPEEIIQTPAHTEELTNSAIIPKPLKTSPRVLRAPKEKPASSVILKRGPEEDVPPVQGSVSPPPASAEKPAVEQGPARSRRPRPPTSLKKVLTPEVHLGEEQSSNSINTEDGDPKEAPTAANQKMSLCTRHQKNRSVEQQGPERLGSAEKVQVKRNAKKSEKTSQDTEPQNQEDGGQQPASRGQARGGRGGLRSGGQNKAPLPLPAEESMESPSRGQKATAGRSVVRGLRAKRTATQSAGSVLDSEAEPRVTRGAKRDAENPVKANDTVNTKRMRTKRQQAGEELQRRR
ncbi:proliferation marker protein Ki-67 [Thomomys bottae]